MKGINMSINARDVGIIEGSVSYAAKNAAIATDILSDGKSLQLGPGDYYWTSSKIEYGACFELLGCGGGHRTRNDRLTRIVATTNDPCITDYLGENKAASRLSAIRNIQFKADKPIVGVGIAFYHQECPTIEECGFFQLQTGIYLGDDLLSRNLGCRIINPLVTSCGFGIHIKQKPHGTSGNVQIEGGTWEQNYTAIYNEYSGLGILSLSGVMCHGAKLQGRSALTPNVILGKQTDTNMRGCYFEMQDKVSPSVVIEGRSILVADSCRLGITTSEPGIGIIRGRGLSLIHSEQPGWKHYFRDVEIGQYYGHPGTP
jgi:hypothetical protein